MKLLLGILIAFLSVTSAYAQLGGQYYIYQCNSAQGHYQLRFYPESEDMIATDGTEAVASYDYKEHGANGYPEITMVNGHVLASPIACIPKTFTAPSH